MVPSLPLLFLLWAAAFALAQSSSSSLSSDLSSSSSSSVASSVSTATNATASGSLTASPTSSTAFPSLSEYSSCVVNCLGLSIFQVGCDSVVDVNCYCNNATFFSQALVECVKPACPGDLASAENVSQQFCNVASSSVSLSFAPLPSPTNSTSSSSSSSASSSSLSSSLFSSSVSSSTFLTSGGSASPTPTQSGSVNQSSGAGIVSSKVPGVWGALALGMGLILLEMIPTC